MRPSDPVHHFWPLRNQRFFCSRLRSIIFGGVEGGIRGHQAGCASQLGPMDFDGRNQQAEKITINLGFVDLVRPGTCSISVYWFSPALRWWSRTFGGLGTFRVILSIKTARTEMMR